MLPILCHANQPVVASYSYSYSPYRLVAASIFPASSPSLLPFGTIKLLLPELLVYLVMGFAHPLSKFVSALGPDLALGYVLLKVFRTHPARVELREEAHKLLYLGLFCGGGLLGVCRGK